MIIPGFRPFAIVALATLVLAQTAHAQSAPTWPQRFELTDGTPASFGFAVTQPGPIRVYVELQGAPVVIALNGPRPQQQAGSGRMQLEYVVTPQDIQQSPYWSVRLTLQQPPVRATRGLAVGSVNVQAPPVDFAGLQTRFNAEAPQRRAAVEHAQTRFNAEVLGMVQQRRAQLMKDQDGMRAAAESRGAPKLDAIRRSAGITTRGLATMTGERVPLQRLKPMPAPPLPQITGTDVQQGLPRQLMLVSGTGFGTQPGTVLFTLAPGLEQPGAVQAWSDTLIGVRVPDAGGIGPFTGSLSVVRAPDNQRSNATAFVFVPELEIRYVVKTNDAVIGPPGHLRSGGQGVYHGWNSFWDVFAGHKNDDVLFPASRLVNGWTVEHAAVYPFFTSPTVKNGNATLEDWRQGTDVPYMRVHWWHDPFVELLYNFVVQIKGPRGMPDGVMCRGTVPNPCS
jgi:hypothetical protein